MNVPISRPLDWLGAQPPLRFVLILAVLDAACALALRLAVGAAHADAAALGGLGLRIVTLVVFTAAAFHRPQDDGLECGVLAAGVFVIGSTLTEMVYQSIAERTVEAALVGLVFAPFRAVPSAFVAVLLSTGMIWVARRVAGKGAPESERRRGRPAA